MAKKEEKPQIVKPFIIKDTREKELHGWEFKESDFLSGTKQEKLDTGDYSIENFESVFTIERKATTSEIANNIHEERFKNELERLDNFKWPFLICEFTIADILTFPVNSGIPPRYWNKIKVKPQYLLSVIHGYMVKYKTKFIFAGKHGQECALTLFKQILKNT